MIKVTQIKLPLKHDPNALHAFVAEQLGVSVADIQELTVVKRSLDARKKSNICYVYTVAVSVLNEEAILAREKETQTISAMPDYTYDFAVPASVCMAKRPVVIGAGPAGLFAALMLAQWGLKPLIIEQGKAVDARIGDIERFNAEGCLDKSSNIAFGEGGAGTFSDGKLYTLINDVRTHAVFSAFVKAGAPEEILYTAKPHIGSDKLRSVIPQMRQIIEGYGGEYRFQTRVTDIGMRDGRVTHVVVEGGEVIETDVVVCAIGGSARTTYEMLHERGVVLEQKAFSIGVRIEHPQELIDYGQYGNMHKDPALPPAEYKLVHHATNGRSVYSFCMCPGGTVVSAVSDEGQIVTNGMSEFARDKRNANSALVVGVDPKDFGSDHPLAGIAFQKKWEEKAYTLSGGNYFAPAQLLKDFMKGRPSAAYRSVTPTYKPGVFFTDLSFCLPDYVLEAIREALPKFDNKIKGFMYPDAVLTGVETRTSSPVRIVRNERMESNVKGLYPIGEGAGYAGGIVSSAVDGIKAAEAIVSREDG